MISVTPTTVRRRDGLPQKRLGENQEEETGRNGIATQIVKTGACLQPHWRSWQHLSSEVSQWLREGVRLPWQWRPNPKILPQKVLSELESLQLDKEVENMLKAGAIQESSRKDLVLSSIYTVPKRDSDKRRPVINLRWINNHLREKRFKMTTMRDVKASITKGCWMAKIDLKDCFWQVPVTKKDQKFLAFSWRGKKYVFKCLPFGMSLSPWFVTKVFRPMIADLQKKGHNVLIYIDDMLIKARTKKECEDSVQKILAMMESLGIAVNHANSVRTPSQQMEYLGFLIDSEAMTISVPSKKVKILKKELHRFKNREDCSPREMASLLGKINAMADAVFPTRIHTSGLHQQKLKLLKEFGGWDCRAPLSPQATKDLEWWTTNILTMNGSSLLPVVPDIKAGTDASDFGWGAWIEYKQRGELKTLRFGGRFTTQEAKEHINYKEMLAVKFLLQSCPTLVENKVIDLGVDNTATVWGIRKYGSKSQMLNHLAAQIWEITQAKNCVLQATHVPGVENVVADEESRRPWSPADWKLHPNLFRQADNRWGPHSIDAFASRENRQINRYACWQPNPECTWVNAMDYKWNDENAWVNPPFSMISRILSKVRTERSTITMVAPLWYAQPWFPALLEMMIDLPYILPHHDLTFLRPNSLEQTRCPEWTTAVWRLSGTPSRQQDFRRKLSTIFSSPGRIHLTRTMSMRGPDGSSSRKGKEKIRAILQAICSANGIRH